VSRGPRLRVIALGLIARPDRSGLLVSSGHDASKHQDFHRLLGGGVDFGETGAEAVIRELAEEIGVAIAVTRFAGVIENIFTYNGVPGHEIVLTYEAEFLDPTLYGRDEFPGIESDPVDASWRSINPPPDGVPLYPPGAIDLLA
jgi:ADP-ribose pyrophosphatase YjhB (NUDIX family)